MADESTAKNRPVERVQVGNVQISVWRNQSDIGDFFTASLPEIRYRDEGEWKTGSSYSTIDLLVLAEAAREASGKIRKLQAERSQGATRAA